MSDITRVLSAIEQGNPLAAEQLLPLVYEELRRLAARQLAGERAGQTLQPTALVHEAYLRLVAPWGPRDWNSRGHFFAATAEAMRRILIENARRKRRLKHGGQLRRVSLDEAPELGEAPPGDLLEIDEALSRFAELEPVKAQLVKLRYFGGLTMPEVASVLGISLATAERHWTFARTWLYAELERNGGPPKA